MKKLCIAIVMVAVLSACTNDPIKEKLSTTIPEEVGYKFISYNIEDTITNADKMDLVLSNYYLLDLVEKKEFEGWRTDLLQFAEKNKAETDELDLDPSYLYKESIATIALMDTILSDYDNIDIYSLNYHRAENKYFKLQASILGSSEFMDYAKDVYSLESKSGRDDFALLNELKKNPDAVYGYQVLHRYSVDNPLEKKGDRLIFNDIVIFDKDWNVVDAYHSKP